VVELLNVPVFVEYDAAINKAATIAVAANARAI
jgi:hypothetical protein